MNITTRTGLVGFFLALSALQISGAAAVTTQASTSDSTTDTTQTVEGRLARLTAAIRQRETLLPKEAAIPAEVQIALGFANGGGGGFANRTGGGGWVNGRGGGFVNVHPWRNAWVNGGGFYNYRY